jgi:hypothetical protein
VLEHKWLHSEEAGYDVGLGAAVQSYLEAGAPAPEVVVTTAGDVVDPMAGLDVEMETGLGDEGGLT